MGLFERAKNIIISPKQEWLVIQSENDNLNAVLITYVLPLALIGAVASYIGLGFIGVDSGILGIRVKGFDWGLYAAIRQFAVSIISVVACTYVVDMLAPSFGSEKNMNRSAQLVGYAYTPGLVGAFLNIIPVLSVLGGLFGLYGLYLWYLGLGPMKKTADDKKVAYLVVSIIILIVIMFVAGFVIEKILTPIFGFGEMGKYGRFGL